MPLNANQQRFVEETIRCGNATEAYMRVYECENRNSANAAAGRLLANVSIKAAIEEGQRRALESIGLTRERWAKEVAVLAFSDVTHYTADRRGRLTSAGPPGSLGAVSSVEVTRTTTGSGANRRTTVKTRVKLWSKPEAQRMAGQALGILKGTLEISGTLNHVPLDTLPDDDLERLEAILGRAAADPGAGEGGEGPPPPQ